MKTLSIKSYAKINLTLEITGVKEGYHQLDSLVASVNLYDHIHLKKRKDRLSFVTMKGMGSEDIPLEENVALRAAEAFSERFQTTGVDVTIFKNIPMGAGLGGSSVDVAGVLNGMATMYEVNDEKALKELADSLGSDTGYMLKGGFARLRGRGTEIEWLEPFPPLHFLLLCPKEGVSSKECYKTYDLLPQTLQWKENSADACLRALRNGDVNEVGRYLMNDLYVPAVHLLPALEEVKKEALSFAPLGVTMTGSGSGILALFETKELCEWAKSRYKGDCEAYVLSTCVPQSKDKKNKPFFRNPFALEDWEKW